MSATSRRSSRRARGCTMMSNGSSAKAASSATRLDSISPVKTMSAATPSSSQRRRSMARIAAAALSRVASVNRFRAGSAISVATMTIEDAKLAGIESGPRALTRALLIAGPTASGKSAAALEIARRFGATIVNADSMQVYADLRILTARPTRDDEALASHRLFGEVDGAVNFSVGAWARQAVEILPSADESPAIVVGGTGLYFRALTEGLSDMPSVPEAVRAKTRVDAEGRPTAELHARLAALDPETAALIRASDRQRTLRALEVFAATGRPLTSFHAARGAPALNAGAWTGLFLAPDRAALYSRIDARFDAMLEAGALAEVAGLTERRLDPALPVMRAHGVPPLLAHLEGKLSLAEAAKRAKLDIRHYAKRQFTWARHQLTGFEWVAPEAAVEAGMRALGA